jgi:hypothetical protein
MSQGQSNPGGSGPRLDVAEILRQLAGFAQGGSTSEDDALSDAPILPSMPQPPPAQTESRVQDHLRELQRITSAAQSADPRKRPQTASASPPRQSSELEDTSGILDWPTAESHVKARLQKDPTLKRSLQKMIEEQRQHEKTW